MSRTTNKEYNVQLMIATEKKKKTDKKKEKKLKSLIISPFRNNLKSILSDTVFPMQNILVYKNAIL